MLEIDTAPRRNSFATWLATKISPSEKKIAEKERIVHSERVQLPQSQAGKIVQRQLPKKL